MRKGKMILLINNLKVKMMDNNEIEGINFETIPSKNFNKKNVKICEKNNFSK